MKSCQDTEAGKYGRLLTLASAWSPSSQVLNDSVQPRCFHQSSEENVQDDTAELPSNILCSNNEVDEDSLPCEVLVNGVDNVIVGDLGIMATGPSSTEYADSMHLIQAANAVALTESCYRITAAGDEEIGCVGVDNSDKLDCTDLVLQSSDHEGQTLSHIDQIDHSDDHGGQPTLCHVDQVVMVTRLSAAPRTLMVDQTDDSEVLNGESIHHVEQTDHSNDGDGQPTLCHVDQVVMVTRVPVAQHTLMLDQTDHS